MGLYRKYRSKLCTLALALFEEPLKRKADYTLVAVVIPDSVPEPPFSQPDSLPSALLLPLIRRTSRDPSEEGCSKEPGSAKNQTKGRVKDGKRWR